MPVTLVFRLGKPSTTWYSCWVLTKKSPARQMKDNQRSRKTYRPLLRGKDAKGKVFKHTCHIKKGFSLPHALGEFYSQAEEATDIIGVMFFQICMYISCVVGVWEVKEVDRLTNQEVWFKYSTVYWFSLNRRTSGKPKMKSYYCDIVWLLETKKARIIAPLKVHREYFDKNSSIVCFDSIKYATVFITLILCFWIYLENHV